MAVCHFPSETAGRGHLIGKGFTYDDASDRWINKAAGVCAWLTHSVRGWHIFFYET